MKEYKLDKAVLFLVFNRFENTKQVFKEIREAKPPRIYIASDGARALKFDEKKVVDEIRGYLVSNIDWDCEVFTLFREENLGCKKAVSSAIDWFFDYEESGIILEDDCLPSQSFFGFCSELLDKYQNDYRVWHIAGNNFNFGWIRDPEFSYYYSYYGSIWGWATWRDRWQEYTLEMKYYEKIKKKNYLWDLFGNNLEATFRVSNFDKIREGLNTWDYQWAYTRFINSGLSIVPNVNLIRNLGFGDLATHTLSKKDPRANMKREEVSFPLKHPFFVIRDKVSDDKFFKDFIKKKSLLQRILKKVLIK